MTKINLGFLTKREESILYSYEFIKNYLDGITTDPKSFSNDLKVYWHEIISREINENILFFLKFYVNSSERLESRANWRAYWKSQGYTQGYTFGAMIPWHQERELRLFKMPNINDNVVRAITIGYSELMEELGLNFRVSYFGPHPSTIEQVNGCIRADGKLDSMELHISFFKEPWRNKLQGGSQHGDITIVDCLLSGSEIWWGATHFDFGSCVMSVPQNRQPNLSFIKNVAKHEATHMFGYHLHHDEISVNGYIIPVRDCLTFHRCTTLKICLRCKDAIIEFWKGVGERTGKKYLK